MPPAARELDDAAIQERHELRRARAVQRTMTAGFLLAAQLLLWLLLRGVIGEAGVAVMGVVAGVQLIAGVLAVIAGVQLRRADAPGLARGPALAAVLVGLLATGTAPPMWLGGATYVMFRDFDKLEIPSLASP